MSKDINDKLVTGELTHDPVEGATVIANDVPRIKTVAELLRGGQERANSKFHRATCVTGNHQLDEATGGLMPGYVWVFGADTNWGKSSALIMLADENIKKGKKVLIVSAEDDEKIYGDRLLIRRSRVSADNFRKRKLTRQEHDKINEVVKAGEDLPCFFDARGRNVDWVTERVRDLIKEYEIDVVAFDYLQAFDGDQRHDDRRMQINYIGRKLTDVCKINNVAGIIFSQITISEGKTHPDKHSIRESRDISNAAEVVILGFTPDKPINSKANGSVLVEANHKCIFLDKNKSGPNKLFIPMPWNDDSACFDAVLDQETVRYQEITGGAFDDFGEDYAA